MLDFICPKSLSSPGDLDYKFRVGNKTAQNCGAPCHGMFFDADNVSSLQLWNGIWAILALIPCSFAVLTFALDSTRFPYPQMAIIHMSICYTLILIFYIIGFISGDSISCGQPFPTQEANVQPERLIR